MTGQTPGERLRTSRLKRRLRQEDVANSIHKSLATYKAWEQGRSYPRTYPDIAAVCKALGITVQYFIVGEEWELETPELQQRLIDAFNECSETNQIKIVEMLEGIVGRSET